MYLRLCLETVLLSVYKKNPACYILSIERVLPIILHLSNASCFFLFLDRIEPFFGRHFSMWHSTKRSSIFRPLRPKFTPQNLHKKSPIYKSTCMADRPEMFGPTRGFSGMADSMEPCKMLWADPCCHGNEIWARRGDPVAYRLVLFQFYSHSK